MRPRDLGANAGHGSQRDLDPALGSVGAGKLEPGGTGVRAEGAFKSPVH